jgi:hypothetical protein
MKRWAIALGPLAVVSLLAACSSSSTAGTSPTYRSHGAPTFSRKGQFDLEQVPVAWANGPGAIIITYNPDGTIAGLHCGVPPS